MDPQKAAKLQKQHYHLVGEHGGVKVCHWTKESMLRGRSCYKGSFYGVESHSCMQMAPAVDLCNLACSYCWREPHMDSLAPVDDDPTDLFLESVRAQRRLISGFKGDERVSPETWVDAQNPKHVAISLNGEPTLYKYLGDFLGECHDHGMTTMLVTNGSLPKVIGQLDPLPTQLYVSVDAPNEEVFNRLCRPKFGAPAWEKLQETLALLPSLDTRTVARHTLIQGESLYPGAAAEYARLDEFADPMFIEAKGYVFVGNSRNEGFTMDSMPKHHEILEFADELAPMIGRRVLDDVKASRVALIGTEKVPLPKPEQVKWLSPDLGTAPPIKHLPLAQ